MGQYSILDITINEFIKNYGGDSKGIQVLLREEILMKKTRLRDLLRIEGWMIVVAFPDFGICQYFEICESLLELDSGFVSYPFFDTYNKKKRIISREAREELLISNVMMSKN